MHRPNRVAATALVLLIALAVLPVSPAQAQGSDLIVSAFNAGSNVVVNVQTTITLSVRNAGNADFSNAQGWEVTLTYRGECLVRTNSVCESVRFLPPGGSLGRGDTVTRTLTWTPAGSQVEGTGIDVVTRIQPISPLGGGGGGGPSTGPDDNPGNNAATWNVFVKAPAVRAVPLRDAADRPGAGPSDPWNEDDIKLSCKPAPQITEVGCKALPGNTTLWRYNVINDGNAHDAYTPDVTGSAVSWLRRAGYRFTFSPSAVSVAPGQSREMLLQIDIPENASSSHRVNVGNVNISLVVSSNLNPSVTSGSDGRTNPPLPSIIIDRLRRLHMTSNETLREAHAGVQTRFNVTLNNTGNTDDAFWIRYVPASGSINDSWQLVGTTTVSVPAQQGRNVTLTMVPPFNATKGRHTIEVEAQSTSDTEGSTHRKLTLVADLQQRYDISASIDLGRINVVPADEARFVVYVSNQGNGDDLVTLQLENRPFGWTGDLSARTVLVRPFSTTPVYLNVTAPPNTPRDTEAALFINGTSQGPPHEPFDRRARTSPVTAEVRVREGPNAHLVTPVTSAFVDAGGSTSYSIVVRNTGNVQDNFTLDLQRENLDWAVVTAPAFAVLPPLQSQEFTLRLRAPQAGVVGETTRVFVAVRSAADPNLHKQTTIEGRVSGPDLYVDSVRANTTTPYSGDPIQLDVVVGNSGNKAPLENATLRIVFVQGSVERVIAEKLYATEELRGGRRISERFLWHDTHGVEGAGIVLARIDPDNVIREIDESPASNEASLALTLRTFSIALLPADGLSGRPGERVAYSDEPHVFRVEYRGNQPSEPVRILVESENGWGRSEIAIALPRGTVLPVLASLDIPVFPGVPRDTLRVTVIPTLRPESTLSATTTTTVLDDAPPRILGVTSAPAAPKLGDLVTITAFLTDETGLASARLHITTPHNETVSLPLDRAGDNRYVAAQAWLVAGTYRYYIDTVDASTNANANTTRGAPATFVVSPGSAPTVKLADGQRAGIRTGTPLRLNITDPLGVASATYTIRGIAYELPRPFSIDTSSWTAGEVDLVVTAENTYGVATTQRFTITVDNTPPEIKRVQLTPETPRINEDVIVRVETDAKVAGVDVLLKRNGQVIETRAATRVSPGVFELLLNPGSGEYAIDVTARDDAGNTKLQERAVLFTAKPANPLPAPGFMLALAALAVVAIARRWRA